MPTRAELNAMIEEACIDAYGEEEQLTGLSTMIDENLALPFQTEVLGVAVRVTSVPRESKNRRGGPGREISPSVGCSTSTSRPWLRVWSQL